MQKEILEQLQRNVAIYGEAPVKEMISSRIDTAIKGVAVIVDDNWRATEYWLCDLKTLVEVRAVANLRH